MEDSPVEQKIEQKNEDNLKKKGLNILGYVIPWWAVLLVVLVILYFAYEKGFLSGILGDVQKFGAKPVELKGPVVKLEVESAPDNVKALFNNAW